jgi:hypothetical protein
MGQGPAALQLPHRARPHARTLAAATDLHLKKIKIHIMSVHFRTHCSPLVVLTVVDIMRRVELTLCRHMVPFQGCYHAF